MRRRGRNGRPRLLACGIAAAPLLAALLAGCGGVHASSPTNAGSPTHAGSPTKQEQQEFQKSLKAATSMRANGVPNYPDPKLIDGSILRNFSPTLKINPSSPAFQRAAQKCGHGQPGLVGPG